MPNKRRTQRPVQKKPRAAERPARSGLTRRPSAPAERTASAAQDGILVAGIGASAGGLEALHKLLTVMPADTGIAFVLIQHLDPTHESLMVELLARDTAMRVKQAADGMVLERDTLYVIPPQAYLAIRGGALSLSKSATRQGARMPFDLFLTSLAAEYKARAICIILSGTGSDGSLGLKAISEQGGLVIAQEPAEAGYDGMPRNAISTGGVNLVLPAARIPLALIQYSRHAYVASDRRAVPPEGEGDEALVKILDLLRNRTAHDFVHYKKATLLRRIRRRMAAAGTRTPDEYVEILDKDGDELELLAKDLLIHVTTFFRDPLAYEALASVVISALVSHRADDEPIRIWVPGCSTGEEAYSLAILFMEQIAAAERTNVKLQIFASDVSADAVGFARAGLYPDAIKADVSEQRLERFFTRENEGYRVSRDLRDAIIFTVQDLLIDPPFLRLDLISCRNLLIYVQPDEQEKILAVFHFALRTDGHLFLGAAESIGKLTDRFAAASAAMRIFRRIGRARARGRGVSANIMERTRALWPRVTARIEPKRANLGELAAKLLLQTFAPAAVVTNRKYEVLYFFGPTDRYLKIVPGEPSRALIPMLRDGLASKVRGAVRLALREHRPAVLAGVPVKRHGGDVSVGISALPMQQDGEELCLVSFVDEPRRPPAGPRQSGDESSRVAQVELELETTRNELESTIRDLEASNQELTALNEEAVSLNEEFQSTNEELETSKEEMQSLNEELTTVNTQLQETIERQRVVSNDLQNILNSSGLATLFLDLNLNIRFFTPAAARLFSIIATDIGRPLSDLANLFPGADMLADARGVLGNLVPITRELESRAHMWFHCGISPYQTQANRTEGVVVTLSDISQIKATEAELRRARAYAEGIVNTVGEPLIVVDADLRVVSASRAFYSFLGASPENTVGHLLQETDAHHLDVPALRAFMNQVRSGAALSEHYQVVIDLPPLGGRTLVVTAHDIQEEEIAERRILVSFNDVTDYVRTEQQLAAAKQEAEQANLAKSRFLAAASHDLRQPLQTLNLLHGMLQQHLKDEEARELFVRMDETLDSMGDTLNALLDINRLESGAIQPQLEDFPIGEILHRLKAQFADDAAQRGLRLRVVPSHLIVRSDPGLLEHMLRNLVSNAIRYTAQGKILLGCRRRGDSLRIEVCDTGVGIEAVDIPRIFEEYRQAGSQRHEGGLGLGLAIVQRLAQLLSQPVSVRSAPGRGSIFAIDVPLASGPMLRERRTGKSQAAGLGRQHGAIMIVEDDPTLREVLALALKKEGYRTATAADGNEAFTLVGPNGFRPDLIVCDYALMGTLSGAQTAHSIRAALGRPVPTIILTGDIRTSTVHEIAHSGFTSLSKPVKPADFLDAVRHLLAAPPAAPKRVEAVPGMVRFDLRSAAKIFVVDDDAGVRDATRELVQKAGYDVAVFASAEAFFDAYLPNLGGCLITDIRMPGMSGFDLLAKLAASKCALPTIVITGQGDVATAVQAMKAGAADFIEKPFRAEELLACIDRALRLSANSEERSIWHVTAVTRLAALTKRQRDILDLVVAGHRNKEIAARLAINQRTVETHRAVVMDKMGAKSLADLVRLVTAAG